MNIFYSFYVYFLISIDIGVFCAFVYAYGKTEFVHSNQPKSVA